jgi:hypothetical protein
VNDDAPLSRVQWKRFCERLSHDVRGPAGIARGALLELRRELQPSEKQERVLGMLERSVDKLLGVADRYARSAETALGLLVAERAPWNSMGEDLLRTIEDVRRVYGRKTISVDVRVSAALRSGLVCPRLVLHVVRDLLGVAIVRARQQVRIEIGADAAEVLVTITTDGAAFPAPSAVLDAGAHADTVAIDYALAVATAHGGALHIGAEGLGQLVSLRLPSW